jgi:raffinose/stachyose/melibiose transport system substrate-binding protein
MKTKKILSIITCGIVIASMLAGCAGPSSTTTPVAAPKAVNLKLYIGMGQSRYKDKWTAYIDQFVVRELKDKNIKITYDLEMPDTTTDATLLKTRLAAGDGLDVFTLHAGNDIPTYGKAGYLTDLTDQAFAKKVLPAVKVAITYDSKVVAVPIESSAWGYIYNKDIFTANKITPPKTLTEMKAVVETLKTAKVTPFLLAYKESWIPQLVNSLAVGSYVNTSDKDFLTRMNKADGSGSYKELTGMFDIMDLINANGTPKPLDLGADAACADFANGKAAMWLQGPWESAAILKVKADFKLGVAALPINDDPKATMLDLGISTSLALCSTSKEKAASEDFLNYILDDKDSTAFYEGLQYAPVATIHNYKVQPWVDDATVYVKAGLTFLDPSQPQAVKDEVGLAMQGYYLKTFTKDAVIKDMDKVWTDSIKLAK